MNVHQIACERVASAVESITGVEIKKLSAPQLYPADIVQIGGLTSEAGSKFNGAVGHIVELLGGDPIRWQVKLMTRCMDFTAFPPNTGSKVSSPLVPPSRNILPHEARFTPHSTPRPTDYIQLPPAGPPVVLEGRQYLAAPLASHPPEPEDDARRDSRRLHARQHR